MNRCFAVLLTLVVSLGLVRPPVAAAEFSGEVKIAGSSTVYPISTALAEEFQKMHPDVNLSVSSTGTGGGFGNFFCTGKTDINDASRPIKPEERKQCENNGVTPIEFRVATDALSVVIHPSNDWAEAMTFAELRKVWGPEDPATKWSDVRPEWPDRSIQLYGAASTSGTFDYLTEVVMGAEDAHRNDYQATEHDNTIVQAVSGSKDVMGYFGFAYYTRNQGKLKAVALAEEDRSRAVKPSLETAQSGAYPLSRPLFIYVSKQSLDQPQVRAFVKFYLRQSSSDIVSQVGYVPVNRDTMLQNLGKLTVNLEE